MYTAITDIDQIAKSQIAFESLVLSRATQSGLITVGYQGGGSEVNAHFVADLDFWIAFADSGNRYWNALGIGNPFAGDRTIIAEINPPKKGIDRRISGIFVQNENGRMYLAHRGRVGGGRKGIGKQSFTAWYKEEIKYLWDDDRRSPMIVIGALDDPQLIDNLAAFTRHVAEFKEVATSGSFR